MIVPGIEGAMTSNTKSWSGSLIWVSIGTILMNSTNEPREKNTKHTEESSLSTSFVLFNE